METHSNPQRHRLACGLSDLPIRDGNNSGGAISSAFASFQTFLSGMETPVCRWGPTFSRPFRPSYQGWKLCFSLAINSIAQSFRPSYQGWKHPGGREVPLPPVLSDLPIRDGNWLAPMSVCAEVSFQTFLSGMETRACRRPCGLSFPFQTFLSGMET